MARSPPEAGHESGHQKPQKVEKVPGKHQAGPDFLILIARNKVAIPPVNAVMAAS